MVVVVLMHLLHFVPSFLHLFDSARPITRTRRMTTRRSIMTAKKITAMIMDTITTRYKLKEVNANAVYICTRHVSLFLAF